MSKVLKFVYKIIIFLCVIIIGFLLLLNENKFPSGFNSFTYRNWFGFWIVIFSFLSLNCMTIKKEFKEKHSVYRKIFNSITIFASFSIFIIEFVFIILDSEIRSKFPIRENYDTFDEYFNEFGLYLDQEIALNHKKIIIILVVIAVTILFGILSYIFKQIEEKQKNEDKEKLSKK